MNCRHVLGLIDAGPQADYPRAHLDAAWRHARQCATCGPALEGARVLATDLSALPRSAPAMDLTGVVLARIAQIEQARVAHVSVDTKTPDVARDWSAWAATVLGGLAAGLAIVLLMPRGEGRAFDIAWAGISGMPGLTELRGKSVEAFVLAAGLMLYVAGLFAPLSNRRLR